MAARILIVEVGTELFENLGEVLSENGYQVDTVAAPDESLNLVEQHVYDMIVLDFHAQQMPSDELLRGIRILSPDSTIIIATEYSEVKHSARLVRHGASKYIVKPICPELLLSSLKRSGELRCAKRRAAQAERLAAIGSVVVGVAHESRNALQRIRARIDLIRLLHPDDAVLLEDLASIEDASEQLRSHFEELRVFSAPIVLSRTFNSLREFTHRVWRNVLCANASQIAELRLPTADIRCEFDSLRIEQVLRNLFENAIDSSDGRAVHVEIDWTIKDFQGERHIFITIRDDGPGFTSEQKDSAFEPFFTTKKTGTGLGLPICRRIMEAHGGGIQIEDNVGNGAAFTLTLPFHRSLGLPQQETASACSEMIGSAAQLD